MISELRNLIISEKQNPDLQSTIDIPTLLLAAENVDMDDLGNRTLSDISREIVQALQNINLPAEKIPEICGKLAEYRLTDQVYQIQKGKHVRWIRVKGTYGSLKIPPSNDILRANNETMQKNNTKNDVKGRDLKIPPSNDILRANNETMQKNNTNNDVKGRVLKGTVGSLITNGGIVVDVKFLDNGTHILCKNGPRFIQYKFDDCITFQKLSADEQMVLSCYDFLRK